MKKLLTFLMLFVVPAACGGEWSHSTVEGEGGGANANYFFYETFKPGYGNGTVMSVQKVRAIYALKPDAEILVIDYIIGNGIRVVEMKAARESLADLIAGRDAEFKKSGEFLIQAEASTGYLKPKDANVLTAVQLERLLNLTYILSMQRSPI